MEDEAMMLDVATGDSFSLNRVATDVWLLLKDRLAVPDIVARVAAKYAVDPAMVARDVDELLAEFRASRLLEA